MYLSYNVDLDHQGNGCSCSDTSSTVCTDRETLGFVASNSSTAKPANLHHPRSSELIIKL
jgi:hypothetical protein